METQKGGIKMVRGCCARCKSWCPTVAYGENGILGKVLRAYDHAIGGGESRGMRPTIRSRLSLIQSRLLMELRQ
jgi:hypothetical protein